MNALIKNAFFIAIAAKNPPKKTIVNCVLTLYNSLKKLIRSTRYQVIIKPYSPHSSSILDVSFFDIHFRSWSF